MNQNFDNQKIDTMKKIILTVAVLFSLVLITNAQYSVKVNTHNITTSALAVNSSAYASHIPIDPSRNADFYMSRSKNQNTAGWVLVSSGVGLIGIALLIDGGSSSNSWGPSDGEVAQAIIGGIGAGLLIASIPCFITSAVYKHKAKVLLNNQKTGFGIPANSGNITGLTLSIPIGK